ncbi:hypothetical protein F4820DRAFT_442314 [Hypoxylon rubiginosum]|uniref:Uncharacterized protein n=1 Tax=Hypoxylon rubiginosum TaxID=110542 RepID=A0ACB9YG53_9PEZI|nr:hypothetical protein F4820DRAFT_442314 [Hypoxylon rubiginosum]
MDDIYLTHNFSHAEVNTKLRTSPWPKHLPKVRGLLEAAEKNNPNIKSWGIIGYYWGGKWPAFLPATRSPFSRLPSRHPQP